MFERQVSNTFTSEGDVSFDWIYFEVVTQPQFFPSKIEWDPTNRPLGKLLELLDTQV